MGVNGVNWQPTKGEKILLTTEKGGRNCRLATKKKINCDLPTLDKRLKIFTDNRQSNEILADMWTPLPNV